MRKVFVVGGDENITSMFNKHDLYRTVSDPDDADIYCFIGGADVNPVMYNEYKLPKTFVDVRADQRDVNFWIRGKEKFKVGICRGGQFLNVKNNGAMWQHVNAHANNHQMIDLLLTGGPLEVTSTHHQMMIPGPDAEVLAIANEATVFQSANKDRELPPQGRDTEVVWYNETRSLCFQPHPEYIWSPKECTDYFFDLIDFFYEDKEG